MSVKNKLNNETFITDVEASMYKLLYGKQWRQAVKDILICVRGR